MSSLRSLIVMLALTPYAFSQPTPPLFGGLGGHNNGDSTNDGALATVNPTTGAVTIVGHPAGVSRISGLAFDSSGSLFASTQPAGGFPPPPGSQGTGRLLTLNPDNGSIIANVPIKLGGVGISIADLAAQPSTGLLYGIRSPADGLNGQGKLYTIDKTTGAATLVGDTASFFGSIAFAPNGTLYLIAANLDMTGNVVNPRLEALNPATAAVLTSVPLFQYFGAFGIRPSDGKLFAGNGDLHQLFTINPSTGAATLVGDTGSTFIGDLAFQVCPPVSITSLTATPNVIWPPDHKMVPVSLKRTVSGGCGMLTCKIVSVSSNEPIDPGGDWVITGDLTLTLRAERLGTRHDNANGRIYTITVQCSDGFSDSTTRTVTVLVPHDQGH